MIGIIIQARLGSTRLPRKVLFPLPTGETVLERVIKAALGTGLPTVVTTPDEELVPYIEQCGATAHLATWERDVLREYITVANKYCFKAIVRLTADCPMLTTDRILNAIKAFDGDYVYVGPDGVDVEIFQNMSECVPGDEHVTSGMVNKYASLDTQEDYEKICHILKKH